MRFHFLNKTYLHKDNFLLFFKKSRWYDDITLAVLFNCVKLSNYTVNPIQDGGRGEGRKKAPLPDFPL